MLCRILFLAAGLQLLAACTPSGADGELPDELVDAMELLDDTTTRVAALESELAIIEERRVYIVLDPKDDELILKVAGAVLKRVPVHVVVWPDDNSCRGGIAVLSAKTPIELPSPPPEEAIANRVRLEETPVGYRLDLECEGQSSAVIVAPLYDSGFESLRAFRDRMLQRAWHIVPFVEEKPTHVLYASATGAQELYWALNPGDFAILR